MKIAIIGPGSIGGNLAAQFVRTGHDITLCFSRSDQTLRDLANKLGHNVHVATPAQAVQANDIVVLSVPWRAIDIALQQAGNLSGKIVVDTTNQFGAGGLVDLGESAAAHNQARMPGAKVAKAFNTLTAGYQAEVGQGQHGPTAMFFAAEDEAAKNATAQLVADAGFEPIYLGGWDVVRIMEAPRRAGAVYGEAYRPADARRIADAVHTDPNAAARLADTLKLD